MEPTVPLSEQTPGGKEGGGREEPGGPLFPRTLRTIHHLGILPHQIRL